ncbi:MAG: GDSL family lipase [Ruminococcaceae bacterium]|nr:GDSL family lipase [Oscillospiraceae bacterium]
MKIIEKLAKKQNDLYGAAPATIAFLGDSVTQGCFELFESGRAIDTVFENKNAYSTRVSEILHMLFPKSHINIVNCGISGDNAPNGLSRLERDILPFKPDLVVVSYGLNDCANGEAGLEKYVKALDDIFKQVKATGAECIFMTENMMNTHVSCHVKNPRFAEIAEGTAKRQNEGVLDLYFDAAKKVAAENGVRVCDCYAKWKAMYAAGVNVTELLANYINHPIRELHYLFAYSLVETMMEL